MELRARDCGQLAAQGGKRPFDTPPFTVGGRVYGIGSIAGCSGWRNDPVEFLSAHDPDTFDHLNGLAHCDGSTTRSLELSADQSAVRPEECEAVSFEPEAVGPIEGRPKGRAPNRRTDPRGRSAA